MDLKIGDYISRKEPLYTFSGEWNGEHFTTQVLKITQNNLWLCSKMIRENATGTFKFATKLERILLFTKDYME